MRDFTQQEMLSITRLSAAQASNLVRSGDIRPLSVGTSGKLPGAQSNPAKWTGPQVLGISVARGLRLLSVPPKEAWEIARLIGATSVAQLEALFGRGRTHLGVIVASGYRSYVHPSLITREEALADNELTKTVIDRTGIPPVALDVQRLWENLKSAVSEIDENRKPLIRTDNGDSCGIVPRAERFQVAG